MEKRRALFIVGIFSLVIWLAACQSPIRISVGQVEVSEIGTCREIASDGQPLEVTSSFSAGTSIVYVYFRLEGPVSVPLVIKWYRYDVLLATVEQRMEPGLRNAWLAAGEGQVLPAGNYEVKLEAGDAVLAEASFVVESDE